MKNKKEEIARILFGSIGKKLSWAFGTLILILFLLAILTYNINISIEKDASNIMNVFTPIKVMVQEIIGYDAILTGHAHAALLHAENNETTEIFRHKAEYDKAGLKLDSILKTDMPNLLSKSPRNNSDKQRIYDHLKNLDETNIKLVELETKAFDSMLKGDILEARKNIVSKEYEDFKQNLSELYYSIFEEEEQVTLYYEEKLLENTNRTQNINVYLAIIFLVISILISVMMYYAISSPIKDISNALDEITKGNLEVQLKNSNTDEIKILTESLNRILASMKLAILRTGVNKEDLGIGEAIRAKEESDQLLKDILDNILEGVLIIDYKGKVEFCNKSALHIAGLKSMEKAIGKNAFTFIHPKNKIKFLKDFINLVRGKKPWLEEYKIVTADNKEKWVENLGKKIKINGKNRIITVFRDITGKKRGL